MIKFRSVNENLLGFGFDWKTTSSSDTEKVIKQECGKSGDKFSYLIPKSDTSSNSKVTLYATTDDTNALESIPAAHFVYDALGGEDNLIYVYRINENLAWVCCIYNHEIVTGGDLIISTNDTVEEFKRLASIIGTDDLSGFSIYVDENISDLEIEQEIEFELNLTDVISSTKLSLKKCQFNKVHSNRNNIIKAIVVAVAVAGSAYYLFGDELIPSTKSSVAQPKRIDTKKLLKKLPQMQSRSTGDFIDKSITKSDDIIVREARKQELEWLNDDLKMIDEQKFIDYLYTTVYGMKSTLAGWKLSKVTFDISSSNSIEFQYIKTNQGTALTLRDELKKSTVIFSPNGNVANTFKILDNMSEAGKVSFTKSSQEEHDTIRLMHDLDMSGVTWSMNTPSETDRQETIKGLKNTDKENKRQLKLDAREVILKGSSLSQFEATKSIFEKTNKFLLERVVININNNVSWSMYGVYYNNFAK
jgi:hypothetical protein